MGTQGPKDAIAFSNTTSGSHATSTTTDEMSSSLRRSTRRRTGAAAGALSTLRPRGCQARKLPRSFRKGRAEAALLTLYSQLQALADQVNAAARHNGRRRCTTRRSSFRDDGGARLPAGADRAAGLCAALQVARLPLHAALDRPAAGGARRDGRRRGGGHARARAAAARRIPHREIRLAKGDYDFGDTQNVARLLKKPRGEMPAQDETRGSLAMKRCTVTGGWGLGWRQGYGWSVPVLLPVCAAVTVRRGARLDMEDCRCIVENIYIAGLVELARAALPSLWTA